MKIQNMQYTNGDVLEMALKWLVVLCVFCLFSLMRFTKQSFYKHSCPYIQVLIDTWTPMKFSCYLGVVFDPRNSGLNDIRSLKYISVEMLKIFLNFGRDQFSCFKKST